MRKRNYNQEKSKKSDNQKYNSENLKKGISSNMMYNKQTSRMITTKQLASQKHKISAIPEDRQRL